MTPSSLLLIEQIGIFMLLALTLRKQWIAKDSFKNEKENDKNFKLL